MSKDNRNLIESILISEGLDPSESLIDALNINLTKITDPITYKVGDDMSTIPAGLYEVRYATVDMVSKAIVYREHNIMFIKTVSATSGGTPYRLQQIKDILKSLTLIEAL